MSGYLQPALTKEYYDTDLTLHRPVHRNLSIMRKTDFEFNYQILIPKQKQITEPKRPVNSNSSGCRQHSSPDSAQIMRIQSVAQISYVSLSH